MMGPPDATATEQHRHACEVRYVAKLPSHAQRRAYLEGVERQRGQGAAQRLREDVWRLLSKPLTNWQR
jgi:hypothetical protein